MTSDYRFGTLLVNGGVITPAQLQRALRRQEELQGARPVGDILVEQKALTREQLDRYLVAFKKRRRLGDLLVASGVITAEQLSAAVESHKRTGERLGEAIVALGYATEEAIKQVLCTQINVPFVDLDAMAVERSLAATINVSYARKHLVIPVARIGTSLTVAIDDPTMTHVIEEIRAATQMRVNIVTSTREKIARAFARLYADGGNGESDVGGRLELVVEERPAPSRKIKYVEDDQTERADAIVRKLLGMAMELRASDVHLERLDAGLQVRFRIDGILQPLHVGALQDALGKNALPVVSRIKVLGNLDIAEKRRPQDGSFRARVERNGKLAVVDLRISIVPGYHGESVVLRLLDKRNAPESIQHLGFSSRLTDRLGQLLRRPTGIVLISGPTGSGKTSTLYGALKTVYRPGIKIVTVEDPIEYVYEDFIQSEVNERLGNTFATYLRAFLRHDPEVIMVGEIRDTETAELAFRAAQTGHLVLSTLHTNDAVSAVTRLRDLGVEPALLTSSLVGVLSQRLVRRTCRECRARYTPAGALLREFFGASPIEHGWRRGGGCPRCQQRGYSGRMPVGELWTPSDGDILAINKGAPFDEIRASARHSTISMAEDVAGRLLAGDTDLEELMRALPYACITEFRELALAPDGSAEAGDMTP
jgi:type IV pilus assembly protein PilB